MHAHSTHGVKRLTVAAVTLACAHAHADTHTHAHTTQTTRGTLGSPREPKANLQLALIYKLISKAKLLETRDPKATLRNPRHTQKRFESSKFQRSKTDTHTNTH